MSTLRAFTITRPKKNKSIMIVKKCYIMKHPHCKEEVWNTKIESRLAYLEDMLVEIKSMYQEKFKVPYIDNICKGDVVTISDRIIMTAFNVSILESNAVQG